MRNIFVFLALAVLIACTPDSSVTAGTKDTGTVFLISPENGFESLWKEGDDVFLYEVGEKEQVEYPAKLERDPSLGLVVRCSLSGTLSGMRRYRVVSKGGEGDVIEFPGEQTVSGRIPQGTRATCLSSFYSSAPSAGSTVRMTSGHVGTVLEVAISGLPSGDVAKVVLKFPVEVCGTLKMHWPSETSAREPGAPDGSTLTIVPSGRDVRAIIAPVSFASGSKVTVSAWIGEEEYMTEYVFRTAEAEAPSLGINVEFTKPRVTYTNPVTTISAADPTIWYDNGLFYLYSTMGSSVKKMYRSKDLVNWTSSGVAPFTDETNSSLVAYGASRWAPDVVKIGDTWNFYITVRNDTSSGIAVLTSKNATGPYTLKGRLTYSKDTGIRDSIDPEVVVDPETGKVWMFFGSTGKMHRIQLNSTGTALAEGAKYEHVAGLDIQDNTLRDNVFDGAYLYRHDGYWYLFCSACQYWNYTYKVVVGRSETLDGTFLSKDGKEMKSGYSTTILSSNSGDRFFGPGHNGEIFTDKYGDDYILYHCHDKNVDDNEKRLLMLQKICWGPDGWPYFEGGKPVESGYAPVF